MSLEYAGRWLCEVSQGWPMWLLRGFVLDLCRACAGLANRRIGAWHVKGRGIARAGGHELFDGFEGLNAAPGSDRHAVQGGSGAGEVELAFEGPILKQAVDEPGVEDISGSGGIDYGDAVGGGVVKVFAVPCEDAIGPQGCGGETAAIALLHLTQRLLKVGLRHEAAGEVPADDEVVDVFEELVYAWVQLVEIGDDGDAGGAGPAGGHGCDGGIVSIDVEGSCVDDPFAVEAGGLKIEPLVAPPEDGALAFAVDEDEGLAAGAVWNGDDLGLDAGAGELFAMKRCGVVVAEAAYVSRLQAPLLAGDDGACDLAAGEDVRGAELNLGAGEGIAGEGDYCVRGIEPDADQVDLRQFRHGVNCKCNVNIRAGQRRAV